jgi:hypothetical protein
MRYLKRASSILLLALVGCTITPAPVMPPPDGPGDCSSACANLARLGGCGIDPATCEGDCADNGGAEAELGVRFPVGCLAAAESCDAAMLCR